MNYRAFVIEDKAVLFEVKYYHKPQRWIDNAVNTGNPIMDVQNWSPEIKYLNNLNNDISDEIKNIPNNTGDIYMFFIKGMCLPFIENYIVYIGRSRFTQVQNIRKRAKEYFSDDRTMIKLMFENWKSHLYYRYYPDTDNNRIDTNEVQLIRSILPPLNETIPDRIEIQETIPAFIN
jgi:hypothetical protein